MKIYLINLKRDVNRLDRILQQFKQFNITNFEIVEAVDGKSLTQEQLDTDYDDESAKKLVRRLCLSEIGCALSHIDVYRRIIKENKRCLIMEDDVVISKKFLSFVNIEIEDPCDVLFFGVTSNNYEHNNLPKTYKYKNIRYARNSENGLWTRCYLEESYTTHGNIDFYDIDKKSTRIDFLYQTFAYSPSVEACDKFIKHNYPVKLVADMVWNYNDFSIKIPKDNIIDVDPTIESNILKDRILLWNEWSWSDSYLRRINSEYFNK